MLASAEENLIERFSKIFGKPSEVATLLAELVKLEDALDTDIERANPRTSEPSRQRKARKKSARA